jgi:3-deoxy-D-manno-octulosonate 8-phosphate phosphatase (KDO 8-P phosphatase)
VVRRRRSRSELDGVKVRWGGRARARSLRRAGGVGLVVLDVDGVLTDGGLHVDASGTKLYKSFGPDDHDAIKRWKQHYPIDLVTSDWSPVTLARADHMKVNVWHAPAGRLDRVDIISELADADDCGLERVVYVGDGYYDGAVMQAVGFGIAPCDAWPDTIRAADAVTSRGGGKRAVAQALDYIGRTLT